MTGPIIEMHKVTVGMGDVDILKNIDLTIERGERIVILGANGSGKSSLIKVMMGEYRHDTSDEASYVRIRGSDLWDMQEVRAAFGLVSSDLQVDFMREMDGLDAVLSGFFGSIGTNRSQSVDGDMEKKACKALKLVGGLRLAEKDISIMSMGEARRVLMARALVNDPEALILDEPMNNLDLTGKHAVRQAMTSIAKAGKTLILVTQDPSDIIPEMDRVIMMKGGKVFRDGGIEILDEKNLSKLFNVPVHLVKRDGRFWAWS
ncbi:MAG: putative ABC transporter ATP-binding protein [Methanomassiliicoccales archaeon PtaU1.Bin124]|nr:MAG: putative ABC transporter ATP-binding protein [Methanomassiliicoccales archaeon PtaU1.Bin124]